jgi:hypothetical protein
MSMIRVVVLVAGYVALALSCGSTHRAARSMAQGSCQSECEDDHPDSLYDRNRCLEDCEPPAPE